MLKLIAVLLLTGTNVFSQSLVSTARWATLPVKIDGIANEWSSPLNFFDVKTRLMFGIANDSTTLYLCFQNPDEKVQSKIFRCGMNVTISIKKLKRKASITYPLAHSGEEEAGPEHEPNMMLLKNNFRVQSMMMETTGFAKHNGMLTVTDTSAIKILIDWNENNHMIYEAAIPFSELFGSNFTPTDLTHELSMQVEILAMEKPHVSGSSNAPPMGAAGVMGGRAMSGMNYQTNTGNKSPWYFVQDFKQKFTLAKKD